jgi:cytochrome d ubiquinol oxidase subunit II
MTVEQAAAGSSTLIALLVGLGIGAFILVPSLFVLFRLVLAGRFDPGAAAGPGRPVKETAPSSSWPLPLAVPAGLATGAAIVLLLATASWLQTFAALVLLGGIALAYPTLLAEERSDD